MAVYPDKKGGVLTGRWRVEVQAHGQRMRGRFDTLANAKAAEADYIARLTRGDTAGAKARWDDRQRPETFAQLCVKARGKVFAGQAGEAQAWANLDQFCAIVGDVTLAEICADDIDAWTGALSVSDATINRKLSHLHVILKWALARGYIAKLPPFDWRDEGEGRIRWLSPADEAQLVACLERAGQPRLGQLVTFAIHTGMRRGEILGLEAKDVQGALAHLWKTKTKTPRTVPLNRAALAAWTAGGPWTDIGTHTLRHYWNRARDEMGLADDAGFTLHACRHTCATRLVQAGVNLRVVQMFLGHAAIETTLRYAHVSGDMLVDAAAALEAPYDRLGNRVVQEPAAAAPI